MCFITNILKQRIANKEVICYKIVRPTKTRRRKFRFWKKALVKATSIFRGYEYIPFKNNPTIKIVPDPYKTLFGIRYSIDAGYHSFKYLSGNYRDSSLYKIVKCIIPKGSTYYDNGKEYVSSNLIMTDEII